MCSGDGLFYWWLGCEGLWVFWVGVCGEYFGVYGEGCVIVGGCGVGICGIVVD